MKKKNQNQKDINLRKFKLIETIISSKDEKLLFEIEEALRQYRIAEYEAKMKPMTKEEYMDKINASIEEVERGEFISLEDYIKEIEIEESED